MLGALPLASASCCYHLLLFISYTPRPLLPERLPPCAGSLDAGCYSHGLSCRVAWDMLAVFAMMFDIVASPIILVFDAFSDDRSFAGMTRFIRVS